MLLLRFLRLDAPAARYSMLSTRNWDLNAFPKIVHQEESNESKQPGSPWACEDPAIGARGMSPSLDRRCLSTSTSMFHGTRNARS
ncbi:hypothetical protein FA13DRAFT_1731779 [Coprinellus micaceus]|uniref:Uncharacterized protein n=1 Tax=Coprinellus micaceus TaxID=71717 RepID=A0A4Y7TEL0_COPMI|nr:hypothetical protein FA13DRAFT_1731779 [Coprinellus micaceus]